MANQSTNSNSPDYFKLLDDVDGNSVASNNDNNILNPNGNFLFANYDFNGNGTGIIGGNNGTVGGATPSTTASFPSLPILSSVTNNQSLEYQFDYGTHSNDSVKQNYEAGSNFMLLLEDFGEYFYNYNGSNGVGGGISSNGSNSNTGFESQTNCSIANSTCADNPGEYRHGRANSIATSFTFAVCRCECESIASHVTHTWLEYQTPIGVKHSFKFFLTFSSSSFFSPHDRQFNTIIGHWYCCCSQY